MKKIIPFFTKYLGEILFYGSLLYMLYGYTQGFFDMWGISIMIIGLIIIKTRRKK